MKQRKSVRIPVLGIALVLGWMMSVPAAGQEAVGTSCADCPNYSGAFTIENTTGVTIPYQVRWGNGDWKHMHLENGHIEKHSYPLGEDKHARVPTPYVRFDWKADDNRFSPREYRMQFFATGYAGYGPGVNKTEPKRYFFRYSPDGKTLEPRGGSLNEAAPRLSGLQMLVGVFAAHHSGGPIAVRPAALPISPWDAPA